MIDIVNITKIYKSNGQNIYALNNINLKIKDGEFLAIVGKSGCGKSTLLNIIAGLVKPTQGTIRYNDEVITTKRQKDIIQFRKDHIGIILQNFSLLNDRDVYANVELPLKIHKVNKTERKKMVPLFLEKVDMCDKIRMYPKNLSGGQQQRVAIARALIGNADIILADEPTGALDEQNALQIISILREIADNGKIVIMVTHNMDFATQCDRCITIDEGELISINEKN